MLLNAVNVRGMLKRKMISFTRFWSLLKEIKKVGNVYLHCVWVVIKKSLRGKNDEIAKQKV